MVTRHSASTDVTEHGTRPTRDCKTALLANSLTILLETTNCRHRRQPSLPQPASQNGHIIINNITALLFLLLAPSQKPLVVVPAAARFQRQHVGRIFLPGGIDWQEDASCDLQHRHPRCGLNSYFYYYYCFGTALDGRTTPASSPAGGSGIPTPGTAALVAQAVVGTACLRLDPRAVPRGTVGLECRRCHQRRRWRWRRVAIIIAPTTSLHVRGGGHPRFGQDDIGIDLGRHAVQHPRRRTGSCVLPHAV